MNGINLKKEEILKFAKFLGLGFYRVTIDGQFVECNIKAREIFGIPQEETDLSKYSITNLYVVPAERKPRIQKLMHDKCNFPSGTLSLRINGKNKLVFDICRYDESYNDKGNFWGLVSEIEENYIFPQMFETFPMGLYEIDDKNRIVRVNKKLVEILKYKEENEVLNRPIKEFYEDEEDLERYSNKIIKDGSAHEILMLKDADNKIIDVECFTQNINKFKKARWGMITDVTNRERYVRAIDKMPTGFYHIEHPKNDSSHEHERVTQCNDRFAQILGFEKAQDAIGKNIVELFHTDKEIGDKFFRDLYAADKNNKPLLNYPFKTRRISDKETIHISIDAHLVKDSNSNVIGREGTIRDITEEIKLRNQVEETQERLRKTTADINILIHTFLHPVIKFAGTSEQLYQVINELYKTIQPKTLSMSDFKASGKKLLNEITELRESLLDIEEKNEPFPMEDKYRPFIITNLKEILKKIENIFDYSLQTEASKILIESTIRDTALWVLSELNRINFLQHSKLKSLIKEDFIDFLQGILFKYLIRGTEILMAETEIMKREVEAFRAYIGLKKKRKIFFVKRDIKTILEENIERFRPILSEKEIAIEYNFKGNLIAEISPNDIDRVICNLLHNAKKYSYGGENRYIKIIAKEVQSNNQVEFSIGSYGIPIKKEEIESGLIFEFGYRGELAILSDRDGTGVGLADARDTAEAHEGNLIITSRPGATESDPPQYKVPYLTVVLIRIPKSRNLKGSRANGNKNNLMA